MAAALADELDGSGLPLCLLPHAYGQQELEASPFGDVDLFTPLRGALPQLWALWELLLLGLPLMVAAPAPGACSAAVVALLSLLAPFPFSLDWRPYFTIHDAAFSRLAAGEAPAAANGLPLVIGLTNLFFLKVSRSGGGRQGERWADLTLPRRRLPACHPCAGTARVAQCGVDRLHSGHAAPLEQQ